MHGCGCAGGVLCAAEHLEKKKQTSLTQSGRLVGEKKRLRCGAGNVLHLAIGAGVLRMGIKKGIPRCRSPQDKIPASRQVGASRSLRPARYTLLLSAGPNEATVKGYGVINGILAPEVHLWVLYQSVTYTAGFAIHSRFDELCPFKARPKNKPKSAICQFVSQGFPGESACFFVPILWRV